MKSIDERIKDLPPALKKEVEEFVNSLLKKRRKKNGKPWQDGLCEAG
jgi:hypothetical protein